MSPQGTLDNGSFNVGAQYKPVVAIDAPNVNNPDVWLYSVDEFGLEQELWTKVDAVEGNNVVYNSSSKSIRNIYSVLQEQMIESQFNFCRRNFW